MMFVVIFVFLACMTKKKFWKFLFWVVVILSLV